MRTHFLPSVCVTRRIEIKENKNAQNVKKNVFFPHLCPSTNSTRKLKKMSKMKRGERRREVKNGMKKKRPAHV